MDTANQFETLMETEQGLELILEALASTDNMGVIHEALYDHFHNNLTNIEPYTRALKLIDQDYNEGLAA